MEESTPQHTETTQVSARNSSSSLLKIIIPVAAIGFLLLVVYTFLSGLRSASKGTVVTPTSSPVVVATPATEKSQVQLPLSSGQSRGQTLRAGQQTEVFDTYALNLSDGWKDVRESDASVPSDIVVLTKDQYTLTISQSPGGSGNCVYAGDLAEDMSQSFTTYVGIPGLHSQFRRGTSDNKTYTVCELKGDRYSFPTSFGYITYTVPTSPSMTFLNEMDAMVASLSN